MFGINIYKFDEINDNLQLDASIPTSYHHPNLLNNNDNKNIINNEMLQVATSFRNKLNIRRTNAPTLYKSSNKFFCAKNAIGSNIEIIVCVMIDSNNISDIAELINLTNLIVCDIQRNNDNMFYSSYQDMLNSNIQQYRTIIQNNTIKRIKNDTIDIKSIMQSNISVLEKQGDMLKNVEKASIYVADDSYSILNTVKNMNTKNDCKIL